MKRRVWITRLPLWLGAGLGAGFSALGLLAETGRRIGKLVMRGDKPALLGEADAVTFLAGDESTEGVLRDPRVQGKTMELIGVAKDGATFQVGPIHTKAMYVLEEGHRLFVTYWCDICAIRTYTPGKCWCCQEDTELQLRERYDG